MRLLTGINDLFFLVIMLSLQYVFFIKLPLLLFNVIVNMNYLE